MSTSKKVLVVDDDEVGRTIICKFLKHGGHSYATASDGTIAWALLESGVKFDLVLCDYQMPGMTGLKLLEQIRANEATAGIPFALMSGSDVSDESVPLEQLCHEQGAKFVAKPFRSYVALIAELVHG